MMAGDHQYAGDNRAGEKQAGNMMAIVTISSG
jgi:hypothetical protein